MKSKLQLLLPVLLLTVFSCEDFEDNRRVLIKGRVSNISDFIGDEVRVLALIDNSYSEFSTDEDIIGRSVVDLNGDFEMTIPVPSKEEVHVTINPDFENSSFGKTQFDVEIPNAVFNDSIFRNLVDLGEIEIQQRAILVLNFVDESPEVSTVSWQLSFSFASCNYIFDINDTLVIDEFCTQAFPSDGELTDESQSFEYSSFQNYTATLEYTINNNATQILDIDLNESFNEITVTY
jgi:hypothetical protein